MRRHGQTEIREWLGVAERAARGAGEFLSKAKGSPALVLEEPGRDVKLSVDREAEDRIIDTLQARSAFPILSEEGGKIKGADECSGMVWIVDPLDGSMNYLRSIPFSCVSVALWSDEEPLLGAIYDFHQEELYNGVVGEGAWLNGSPIHVGDVGERSRAILSTGFPVGMDFSSQYLSTFLTEIREYKKVRMMGSAALSLAYVASARTDAYLERGIKIWDVAAGIAIVLAAGGRVARRPSAGAMALTVYAGNSKLPAPALV